MFGCPSDSELGVLGDVSGKDVIELGCGTAYFGAWLAKRGARVTGVDITPAQLETARRCSDGVRDPDGADRGERGRRASSGCVVRPCAISEYGASIWCDPYEWIPEAARLLRPGGELVFLRNSTLAILCSPDDRTGRSVSSSCGHSSGCTGSSGRMRTKASSSSCRTASGFACSGATDSTSRVSGRSRRAEIGEGSQLLRLRVRRVGAQVAGRGDLEGPQARVSVPPTPPIVLASVSPQRRAILEQLDLPFIVVPPRLRGVRRQMRIRWGSCASTRAGRRARSGRTRSARCSASTRASSSTGQSLGKPGNAAEAEAMLERLSGRTHEVVSGLCLRDACVGRAAPARRRWSRSVR